jgi:hypothetical protein
MKTQLIQYLFIPLTGIYPFNPLQILPLNTTVPVLAGAINNIN